MALQETLVHWMAQFGPLAIGISLLLNIAIAIAGVLPSVVLTAANLLLFGFEKGLAISILGESAGAAVSFILYRHWFAKKAQPLLQPYPKARQLLVAKGYKAAGMVFTLRLMPFVPSGLVTWAAAVGRIHLLPFVAASTLGKIPALILEALLVQGWLKSSWPWQIGLAITAVTVFLIIAYVQQRHPVIQNEPERLP